MTQCFDSPTGQHEIAPERWKDTVCIWCLEATTPDNLTQLPVPGLDDLTRADVEREIKGAVYLTRRLVERAHTAEAKEHAQRALDAVLAHARAEGIDTDKDGEA